MAIHYELDEHIVLITIDRPEARNSADLEHFKRLREAWERFDADPEAWVAIITGVGDAFFTGADLKTYTIDFATRPAPEFRLRFTDGPGFGGMTRTLNISKPIVAASVNVRWCVTSAVTRTPASRARRIDSTAPAVETWAM